MNIRRLIPVLLIATSPQLALAGRFHYVPYIAPSPWVTALIVTNPAPVERSIHVRFLSGPGTAPAERAYTVPGFATLRLVLGKEFPSAVSAILESDDLDFGLRLEYGLEALSGFGLSGIAAQNLIVTIPDRPRQWAGIAISNMGDLADTVTVAAYGPGGARIGEAQREIPAYSSVALLVDTFFAPTEQVRTIHISGKNRLAAMSMTQLNDGGLISYPAGAGVPAVLEPAPGMTYFLVANPSFGTRSDEAYVLALSDPGQIAQARAILLDPSRPRIVAGSISRGNGSFNRNLTEPGSPAYSWHIDRFEGFSDLAAEVCDGGPVNVDFDLAYWLEKVGRVCFWGQTVVREITAEEVRTGALAR